MHELVEINGVKYARCPKCKGLNSTGVCPACMCPPTPPATPAEMPECVRELVDYILSGMNLDPVMRRCEKYAAAVRDHYAKEKA